MPLAYSSVAVIKTAEWVISSRVEETVLCPSNYDAPILGQQKQQWEMLRSPESFIQVTVDGILTGWIYHGNYLRIPISAAVDHAFRHPAETHE